MTVSTWEPAPAAVEVSPTAGVMRISDWAQEAQAAHHLARLLVATAFCPQQFRNKPEDGAAAILAGSEVGLSPLTSLNAFDIIQGRVAAQAKTLRALVQAHGHELVLVESTATRCRMKGRRKDSDEWQTVTWTIDRAKALGLTGKDNWKKQPQAMLVARATSELCRLIASDAILGIGGGYSIEEIADGGSAEMLVEQVTTTPAAPSGSRRMSRPKPAVKAAPEPEPEPEPVPEPADVVEGEPLLLDTSSKLAKAMYATIRDMQIPEDERIVTINRIIGREIESTSEMTEDEARAVLAELDAWLKAAEETEPAADADGVLIEVGE